MPLHSISPSSVPAELIDDWNSGQIWNIRFNADGNFYWVTNLPYTIENNSLLHYQGEVCQRVHGSKGLPGSWKHEFPSGEWIKYTYGNDGFYAYEWSNGDRGGGFYSGTKTHLNVVEFRGTFQVNGTAISLVSVDGQLSIGSFTLMGNSLTIHWQGEEPITYVRLPVVV